MRARALGVLRQRECKGRGNAMVWVSAGEVCEGRKGRESARAAGELGPWEC